jgi:hypothetical protein
MGSSLHNASSARSRSSPSTHALSPVVGSFYGRDQVLTPVPAWATPQSAHHTPAGLDEARRLQSHPRLERGCHARSEDLRNCEARANDGIANGSRRSDFGASLSAARIECRTNGGLQHQHQERAHQRPRAGRLDPLRSCFPGFHQWPLVGIAWEDSKVAKARDNHCPTSAHQARQALAIITAHMSMTKIKVGTGAKKARCCCATI